MEVHRAIPLTSLAGDLPRSRRRVLRRAKWCGARGSRACRRRAQDPRACGARSGEVGRIPAHVRPPCLSLLPGTPCVTNSADQSCALLAVAGGRRKTPPRNMRHRADESVVLIEVRKVVNAQLKSVRTHLEEAGHVVSEQPARCRSRSYPRPRRRAVVRNWRARWLEAVDIVSQTYEEQNTLASPLRPRIAWTVARPGPVAQPRGADVWEGFNWCSCH